jgi:hypothetical protein
LDTTKQETESVHHKRANFSPHFTHDLSRKIKYCTVSLTFASAEKSEIALKWRNFRAMVLKGTSSWGNGSHQSIVIGYAAIFVDRMGATVTQKKDLLNLQQPNTVEKAWLQSCMSHYRLTTWTTI